MYVLEIKDFSENTSLLDNEVREIIVLTKAEGKLPWIISLNRVKRLK